MAGKTGGKTSKKPQPSYDELRSELDAVLAELQGDGLDIDKALKAYARGLELVRQLEQYLESAENTVREIKAGSDRGGR